MNSSTTSPASSALSCRPANGISQPDSSQNKAMDANINALEGALLNYTLWQYVPDNDPFWGDLWNGEDLSIWQQQQQSSRQGSLSPSTLAVRESEDERSATWTDSTVSTILNSKESFENDKADRSPSSCDINQRHLVCLYRPRPRLTAGIPIAISFTSPTTKIPAYYRYEFQPSTKSTTTVTELYVPKIGFPPPGPPDTTITQIKVSQGKWKVHRVELDYWLLHWWWDDDFSDKPLDNMVLELKGSRWA
jgi:hypothetical protein